MPRAYVLFNVGAGSEEQVLKDAKAIGGVQEAYVSYGVYDLVMNVKADTMEKLKEIVTHRLRRIANVRSTLTLLLTEESLSKERAS
jgi:DNA-binding Lrp family transcriptional regulator